MMDTNNKAKCLPLVEIGLQKIRGNAFIPSYAHYNDAGLDLVAAEEVWIFPGQTKLIGTGLALAIPDGFEAQIRPRSGLSLRTKLRLPNSPGTIDAGYRGEIKIILENTSISNSDTLSHKVNLENPSPQEGIYKIEIGDKIAQLVLVGIHQAKFKWVENISLFGKDRGGGFGSTGLNIQGE